MKEIHAVYVTSNRIMCKPTHSPKVVAGICNGIVLAAGSVLAEGAVAAPSPGFAVG